MADVYLMVLAITVCVLIGCAITVFSKTLTKKNKIYNVVVLLFVVGTIAVIGYMTAIGAKTVAVAEWGYAVYFMTIDWLLVCMLRFARLYCRVWEDNNMVPIIYIAFSGLDTLSLMLNFRYHHAFSVYWFMNGPGEGWYLFTSNDYYMVHLTLCYILVLIILIVFTIKTVTTSGFHRSRYITVLLIFVAIIVINAIFLVFKFTLDVSIALYAIACILIGYYVTNNSSKQFVEYMLSTIAEKMDCALVAYDENDTCIYYNQLASRVWGMNDTAVVLEEVFRKWKDGRITNSIQNTSWSDIFEVNGEETRFDVHFTKLYDKKGQYSGCYFSGYDVTSDYVAYEEEKYRSSHDSLTGALNRDSFYEEVRKILELYPTTDYVMVCSDIKGFKLINDMFGLDVADRILIKISDVIRARIQAGSAFARLEADRFAVLMPKERFSEELFLTGISEVEYILNNSQYRMNILVGVYDIYDRSASVASMCDRAFLAIESIKENYKDQIAYYGDMLRNEYMNEQKIIGEFENALSSGQFAMFLQPIVDKESKCTFAEALVRWIHPDKGIISPGGFIPVLESTGYIYKLDLYIWEQACKRLAYWKASGHDDMSISVNISVKDFYYIDIYDTLVSLVEKYHINPANLKLEITESVFMTEKDRQLDIIYALKDYGFIIEIDDFGSGFSSLNMLKEVPANVLKIDMNFLAKTAHEEKGKTIIETIILLAKALDMKVVVEGIEDEEQLIFLRDAGADLFQGYFFDKPIPLKSFEDKYVNS